MTPLPPSSLEVFLLSAHDEALERLPVYLSVVAARGLPDEVHNLLEGSRCSASYQGNAVRLMVRDVWRDLAGPSAHQPALPCTRCSWERIMVHPPGKPEVAAVGADLTAQRIGATQELETSARVGSLEEALDVWHRLGPALTLFPKARNGLAHARAVLGERLGADLSVRAEELVVDELVDTLLGPGAFAGLGEPRALAALPQLRASLAQDLLSDPARVLVLARYGLPDDEGLDLALLLARSRALPISSVLVLSRAHFQLLLRREALVPDEVLELPGGITSDVLEAFDTLFGPGSASEVATLAGAYEVASAL